MAEPTPGPRPEPGTVIAGTHLSEDLVPTLLGVLELHDPARAEIIMAEYREDVEDPENADPYFVNEVLFDALQEIAPPGHYFGSHPGDGSDFGFWEEDDPF